MKVLVSESTAVIPTLIKVLKDEDKDVRCPVHVGLKMMAKSAPEKLRVEAARAIEGIEDRCSEPTRPKSV